MLKLRPGTVPRKTQIGPRKGHLKPHEGKKKEPHEDFPSGLVDKNLPAVARDTGLVPVLGRFHIPQSN